MPRRPPVTVETYNLNSGGRTRRNGLDPARLGAVIRLLRENKRWRQVDLAREARVSVNTVNGLEQGRRTQDRNVEKIARVFGTSAAALARGEMPPISSGVADVRIAGLSSEDFEIARAFHHASTPTRLAVKTLLQSGRPRLDYTERIVRLDPERQEEILTLLAAEERDQSAAEAAIRPSGQNPKMINEQP